LEEARGDQQKFDAILDSMNLSREPDPGDMFINPVYDFTTKLETTDRAITYNEAQQMAGLDDWEFDKLLDLARLTNEFITQKAEAAGFEHYDGKIETMYNKTEILLVDAIGTFDENRFTYQDEQISKEILRQAYKSFQPEWVNAVSQAKTEAAEKNDPDWKSYCQVQPKPLPEDFVTLMSNIYKSGANKYIGSEVFAGVPSLDALIPELGEQRKALST
jgi:phosphoribosylaminoimidazole-succinocarboxamide synthase